MTQVCRWRMRAGLLALLVVAGLAVGGGICQAAPAPAARSGLEQIPATAPIVVYLRGVEGTRDRLVAMLENALPDQVGRIKTQLDSWIKDGVGGRKLAGLAKNGPIFLVFTEMPKPNETRPKVAVIAAVTDYKAFRDGLLTEEERKEIKNNGKGVERAQLQDETVYFVDRKGYAILTPVEEVAESFTKQQPGLDTRLSKEQAAKLLAADLAGYLSMDTFNKDYAEQIKQFRDAAENGIKQALKETGKADQRLMDLVERVIGGVFQAAEDSQGALLTFEFRPAGLVLHAESEVRPASPTAKALKEARPAPFTELGELPAGRAYYTALKVSKTQLEAIGPLLFSVVNDPDSKDAKAIASAVEDLVKAGPRMRLDAVSLPPSGIQVWKFDDPAKAVQAQLKLFKSLAAGTGLQGGSLKEKPVVKEKAEKFGDMELNSVELVWDLDKMAEQAAAGRPLGEDAKKQVIEGLKGMLGEKLTIWFGTDGKVVLQVSAGDWATASKLLEQFKAGKHTAASAAPFRDARKEMPRETTLLGLVDIVQYAGPMMDMIKPMIGFPLPPGYPAPAEKGATGFLGLAVTLEPRAGGLDLFISADAVRELYKSFVKPLVGGR
jgi:hypothetical protein